MAGLVNFEDEEEVMEFLDNLGVEYHYQCRREKDPEGCQRLADYFEAIKRNFDAAARVYKDNCETHGHTESCYKQGMYHYTGKGGLPRCLKSAYSCFLRACNNEGKRYSESCYNVGIMLHNWEGAEGGPDVNKALPYYMKACAGGSAGSCFVLSSLYMKDNSKGLAPDMTKALAYATRACELDYVEGCINASLMYKLGEGTEKNEKKAAQLNYRARYLAGFTKEKELKFGQ